MIDIPGFDDNDAINAERQIKDMVEKLKAMG